MALISKIRNNSWLLVTVIGLALAAFILMDMTSSGNRRSAGDFTLGTVNGEPIDYKKFQSAEQALYTGGGNTYANRNYLWNYFVEKTLIGQFAEKLGFGVSRDELMELQFGNNLSPIITQRFSNRQTGQVDRQTLNNMRQAIESGNIDPNQRNYWAVQEQEIISNRIQSKINALVSKGIYTPGWMAELKNTEQKATANFNYVKIPYADVENSAIEVSDDDLKAFLNENLNTYRQSEETRLARYVSFDILPTKQDSQDIFDKLVELKGDLTNAENDSTFVVNQNGIYNTAYLKATDLTPALKDTIFDLEVGSTYGPFIENGQYQVIKILDSKVIPDSVESRHILRPVQTQEEFIAANALIDSLRKEINTGTTTFEAAAQRFGSDGTRTVGGDLGYASPGRMVKPFNDLIFYQAEEGKLYKIVTQFGLHLVEVTDRKFETNDRGVQYATLYQNIVPSQETQSAEYERIFDFISENNSLEKLTAALPAMNKEFQSTAALKKNDFTFGEIGQSPTAREIIRWLFTPGIKVGETSPDVYIHKDPDLFFNSKLLLVALSEINDGELPGIESVRRQIEPLVINNKKGEYLVNELSGKDMNVAADQFGVDVQEANNIGLSSSFVPGMGNEPEVLGKVFTLESGETLGPIAGKDGVYYIKMNGKTDAPPIVDIAASKNIFAALAKNQVNTKLWPAVREAVEIEDNRYTYY